MTRQIQDLVQFFAQHHHVPISLFTESWQIETWDRHGIAVVMPSDAENARAITKLLPGDLVVVEDVPVARISRQWLVFFMWHTNRGNTELARKLIDQHLPRMCRTYRHEMRDQLVTGITSCVQDRRKELQSSIREDGYELERLSLQILQLARKLETDRQILKLFEKAPEWIKARATHTYVDLMKLVPGTYQCFRIQDDAVIGVTHDVTIEHEGTSYHFDEYEVSVNLRDGKINISGGTNINGYISPHITDESSICWGNIAHLVERLVAEIDLFGLFQLIDTFLKTYNPNDPYQRIEKWDPDWVDDEDHEDEEYCSWCDSYGHSIEDCEDCHWCSYCDRYEDHDEEDCPNRPQEQTEEVIHAVEAPA